MDQEKGPTKFEELARKMKKDLEYLQALIDAPFHDLARANNSTFEICEHCLELRLCKPIVASEPTDKTLWGFPVVFTRTLKLCSECARDADNGSLALNLSAGPS